MRRNRRKNLVDALFDAAVFMPYWAGILLASFSFLILHQLADLTPPQSADSNQMGSVGIIQMLKTFAYVGQFIVPFCFLTGALISSLRSSKRGRLFASANGSSDYSISKLSWREFEQFITEFFFRQGFTVQETPEGADGGVDIFLKKDKENFIAQYKHWKKRELGVQVVREQFGIMHAREADGVFIVTSGNFSEDAVKFSRNKPIMLMDGRELKQIVQTHPSASKKRVPPFLPLVVTVLSSLILIAAMGYLLVTQQGGDNRLTSPFSRNTLPSTGQVEAGATLQPVESYMAPEVVQPEDPNSPTQYVYSYMDTNGVFQTISSSEKLDYELADGIPHYSGNTTKGKRLATFLNENKSEKAQ